MINVEKFINLTPHDVVVITNGEKVIIPRSGKVIRLGEEIVSSEIIEGVEVVKKRYLPPSGFQPEGKVHIVSILALKPLQEMFPGEVFVAPDTGPESVIRDQNGRIIGVKRFQM